MVVSKRFGSEYHVVFRFPYITPARVLIRLKLLQTAITFCLPVCRSFDLLQIEDNLAFNVAVGMSAVAMVMLYVMGEFFRRLVGQLSLSKDGTTVIISHLTFFGGRRDLVLPVSDIVPLAETSRDQPDNLWFTLRRYSVPRQRFYMSLRGGGVFNTEQLRVIIGHS